MLVSHNKQDLEKRISFITYQIRKNRTLKEAEEIVVLVKIGIIVEE